MNSLAKIWLLVRCGLSERSLKYEDNPLGLQKNT